MRVSCLWAGLVLFVCLTAGTQGQSLLHADSATNASSAPVSSGSAAGTAVSSSKTVAAASSAPAPASSDDEDDNADMGADDFTADGAPCARVLYLEGNVWIRQPDASTFHLLAEDEPIAQHSIIYTGANGILDFATGPGMAVRMVPKTLIKVSELPAAATLSKSTSDTPETAAVGVKKGSVFAALGRSDGEPIDFEVRTPEGVAGARGTMFSTTTGDGQAEVSMLHGTVNFETPDHQTSQITAGQSQQVSGSSGGKFQFAHAHALSPRNSSEFFNHAGGLLEHASGYGVVRRGLGPDVAKTLHEHGYSLPPETQKRFQNASQAHYQRRTLRGAHPAHAGGSGKTGSSTGVHSGTGAWHSAAREREEEAAKRRSTGKDGLDGRKWGE